MTRHHLTIDDSDPGMVTVRIDLADRPVNVLNASLFGELDQLLEDLVVSGDERAVVFRSGKASGFLAGADLKELAAIRTRSESDAVVNRGLDVFQKLAALPQTTIAVIDGSCLGGGLEFALACSERLAVRGDRTRLGLPEVNLGLIPAWGASYRLARLTGLERALQIMLSGKTLTAEAACDSGLLSRVVDESHLTDAIAECIRDGLHASRTRRHVADWWVLQNARRRYSGRSTSRPACRALVRLIRTCRRRSPADWPEAIRETFARLLLSQDCRRRLDEFFSSRAGRS